MGNEIVAIPLLLERLALTGALVTIDAMGTQTKIAETIVRRGGDYLLALKANRPVLFGDVEAFFDDPNSLNCCSARVRYWLGTDIDGHSDYVRCYPESGHATPMSVVGGIADIKPRVANVRS